MADERRASDPAEVRAVVADQVPVGRAAEGGEQVSGEPVRVIVCDHRNDEHERAKEEQQRGREATNPANVVPPPVDPAGAPVLGEQDRREQISRQHEEHLDPEETARQAGGERVIQQHRDECHGSQPVKRPAPFAHRE